MGSSRSSCACVSCEIAPCCQKQSVARCGESSGRGSGTTVQSSERSSASRSAAELRTCSACVARRVHSSAARCIATQASWALVTRGGTVTVESATGRRNGGGGGMPPCASTSASRRIRPKRGSCAAPWHSLAAGSDARGGTKPARLARSASAASLVSLTSLATPSSVAAEAAPSSSATAACAEASRARPLHAASRVSCSAAEIEAAAEAAERSVASCSRTPRSSAARTSMQSWRAAAALPPPSTTSAPTASKAAAVREASPPGARGRRHSRGGGEAASEAGSGRWCRNGSTTSYSVRPVCSAVLAPPRRSSCRPRKSTTHADESRSRSSGMPRSSRHGSKLGVTRRGAR